MSKSDLKDNLFEVKSPCTQDWAAMRGNDKVRFCEHCALDVKDISKLRRKDALRLVRKSEGRLCVRYVKNPANNQPVFADTLHQITRRTTRIAAGAMTAALSLSTMAYAQGGVSVDLSSLPKIEQSKENDKTKTPTEPVSATLSGTITDVQGAVIPNVSIILTDDKTGERRVVLSNEEGVYEIKNLPAATYTLKAEGKSGFMDYTLESLEIADGESSKKDVQMQLVSNLLVMGDIGILTPSYTNPLFIAVDNDEPEEVISAISKGANVNVKEENHDNITPLFLAVENGNAKIVKLLLGYGAKVNARNDDRKTPLMNIDGNTELELVELLLSYGAKLKAVDEDGSTVLHYAGTLVKPEVLKLLISRGADIDAQNEDGKTALMDAVEFENLEAVKILLEAGAKVNLRNKDGDTALALARENEYHEIAELLIAYGAN